MKQTPMNFPNFNICTATEMKIIRKISIGLLRHFYCLTRTMQTSNEIINSSKHIFGGIANCYVIMNNFLIIFHSR